MITKLHLFETYCSNGGMDLWNRLFRKAETYLLDPNFRKAETTMYHSQLLPKKSQDVWQRHDECNICQHSIPRIARLEGSPNGRAQEKATSVTSTRPSLGCCGTRWRINWKLLNEGMRSGEHIVFLTCFFITLKLIT